MIYPMNPVLKRLSDQQMVDINDRQFQGRNRKYYHLTAKGQERLETLVTEWNRYTQAIGAIVSGQPKSNEDEGRMRNRQLRTWETHSRQQNS